MVVQAVELERARGAHNVHARRLNVEPTFICQEGNRLAIDYGVPVAGKPDF